MAFIRDAGSRVGEAAELARHAIQRGTGDGRDRRQPQQPMVRAPDTLSRKLEALFGKPES